GSVVNKPIENILVGKNGTLWKMVSETPVEVVLCLDDVYALNRIRIAHASEASMMSVFNASDYTVSFSTDGNTFTRVIDVTDNSMGFCEYNFEQTLASYIKITLTKGSITDANTYYLAEVMAYGTAYTGTRDGMAITVGSYVPGGDGGGLSVLQIVLLSVFGVITVASVVFILIVRRKTKS
ncbi:MAG: discoidin domain-containing protein, partial [Clostridia bacterium]|nr:discoidin domain-containing protein [Clostridia bacterium]